MKILLLYFGTGIVVLVALWILFRKTGVDPKGLRIVWGRWLISDLGFVLVPLLWPLFAVFSVLWWMAEYLHLKARQKDAWEKAEALKHANPYSHLTMDELLAKQKKLMDESQDRK